MVVPAMRRQTLTDAQRNVLDAIRRLRAVLGYVPTYREIATELNVNPNAVHCSVRVLEEKGYIRRGGRQARALQILVRAKG